jgi:putative hydrolase of the HAD superfamily
MNMVSATPPSLDHVTDWVFDLDNTLYPRECNLFAQIDTLITHYMMSVTKLEFIPARTLQKEYYRDFGTTLNGLMQRHEVDPDHFLSTVHSIDYSPVAANTALIEAIRALPGRKFILTNGDVGHARAVLGRLGPADDLFEDVFDIRAMSYRPKPLPEAYDTFFQQARHRPAARGDVRRSRKEPRRAPRRRDEHRAGHRRSGLRSRSGRGVGARTHRRPACPSRDG